MSTNTGRENGLCVQRSVFTSRKSRVPKYRCVCVDVRLGICGFYLFVGLFYSSTARPDSSLLSPQLRHEPRPRAEFSVELWSEATEVRRQENTTSAHAQERYG